MTDGEWLLFLEEKVSSFGVKLYDVPVGFVTPPPILRLYIALFAVAEGWLLLDIGWFVSFFSLPPYVHMIEG